ncbi:MAG: hypothetical protein DWI24_06565 [Planctomycetota bacterium]|nr:MAG: hypothetical protein DWI24_06565 [Planctomycetota bacterium]
MDVFDFVVDLEKIAFARIGAAINKTFGQVYLKMAGTTGNKLHPASSQGHDFRDCHSLRNEWSIAPYGAEM